MSDFDTPGLLPFSVAGKHFPTGFGIVPSVTSPLGDYLMRQWDRLEINQAEFSRRVHENSGFVQQIKGGKTLPAEKIDLWADVLGLEGDERRYFSDLCGLAHVPAQWQARFLRLIPAPNALPIDRGRAPPTEIEAARTLQDTVQLTAAVENRADIYAKPKSKRAARKRRHG